MDGWMDGWSNSCSFGLTNDALVSLIRTFNWTAVTPPPSLQTAMKQWFRKDWQTGFYVHPLSSGQWHASARRDACDPTFSFEGTTSWILWPPWVSDPEHTREVGELHSRSAGACVECSPQIETHQGIPASANPNRCSYTYRHTSISSDPARSFLMTIAPKKKKECLTWDRAHSRTVSILSCSGWKHIPTFPIGWGSVIEVGKFPSQSNLPKSPFHWLCRFAVLGRHHGIRSTTCPDDNLTYSIIIIPEWPSPLFFLFFFWKSWVTSSYL